MSVSAADIKKLREMTGAGIKKCKEALVANDGNIDQAAKTLREQLKVKIDKRAGRDAKEGIVKVYSHPGERLGVLVELNCETDFVARNDAFLQLAQDVALQVASMAPRYVSIEDVPEADLAEEREILTKQAMEEGKPEEIAQKMVVGRMRKFYEEYCLLEMPFVKDDKVKVKQMLDDARAQLGENIVIRRFVRYDLGEDI